MTRTTFIKYIGDLIAKDDLNTALAELKTFLEHTPLLREVLHQSGRYAHIAGQIRMGTVSHADANLTRNQISVGLLGLLAEIESTEVEPSNPFRTPAVQAEIEGAVTILQSKNVVVGSSITAGGSVVIGDNPTVTYNYAGKEQEIPSILAAPTASVPATFVGREKEIEDIRTLLKGRHTITLVNSEGGMGKTTIAAKYWESYKNEYCHLAWLYCEEGILAAMLKHLPYALGIHEDLKTITEPDLQFFKIKDKLAGLNKDCLLVLDNANNPNHIEGFLRMANGLGWHVLLTSRCSGVMPNKGAEYPVQSLPMDKAKILFKENYEEEGAEFDKLLENFIHAVGGNTLCIEVFSKHSSVKARMGYGFHDFLETLKIEGLILEKERFKIQTDYTNNRNIPSGSSADILEALYDIEALNQTEKDILIPLSLLPAEEHSFKVLNKLFAIGEIELFQNLQDMAMKGWIANVGNGFRMSQVVQGILLKKNKDALWQYGEPILRKLNQIFEPEGYFTKDPQQAVQFIDLCFPFLQNLNTSNEGVIQLFDGIWYYFNSTGNLSSALDAAKQMEQHSEKVSDKNGLAISYEKLGDTHNALGNLDKAHGFYKDETVLFEELYAANPKNVSFKNGLANSYEKLGNTHSALGNLDKALGFYEDETVLFEELHEAIPKNVSFKNGLAISYSKLGQTHSALGNLDKALEFYEAYNRLKRELYKANPKNVSFKNGLAISYSSLGQTHSALGHLDKALGFYEKDFELTKELYEANPKNVSFKYGLATSYSQLGWFFQSEKNDKATARIYYLKCKELAEALANDFPDYVEFQKRLKWVENALSDLD